MKLIGFNLTKVSYERINLSLDNLKIDTSINLSSIEELKDGPKDKNKYLEVKFIYNINYSPKVAKIELGGTLIVSAEEKTAKDILSEWKSKKLKEETRVALFNAILIKCNIKAVQIEDDLRLPTHFQLPSLKTSKKE